MQQRTVEWYQARLGKPTASNFHRIKYGRKQGEWSQATLTYMNELLAELLTGEPKLISTAATEWGIEHEDEARELFTKRTGIQVYPCGFYELEGLGGSPDGITNRESIIEIKCPYNSANHVDYMLNGPGEHIDQMQANMYFTNKNACHFISYDPRMPEQLQLYYNEIVLRDDQYIADMLKRVKHFANDLNTIYRKLVSK